MSGSLKKMTKSISSLAMRAPIWRSPPSGPDLNEVSSNLTFSLRILPVVLVAKRVHSLKTSTCSLTNIIRSIFFLS
ncbi:hypothetical protein V512_004330 [Mesotoga sp. Brook.08.105.5.1]|nr:hypothetical protein V512_004330 [Mesotoga sp. Brook.08.105.5.1]RAM58521.1 hypothetical protein DS65_01510 [Mesotoga sp. SC_4PWL113PWK15]RAM60125.1 hypothetical protein DS67_02100 [Mesotoga sp. SC_4PWA21]RAO97559.1 hypothetical protein M388_10550 [Mesotoga sp. Brook.08.YT.4.2.5.4.]RDI93021.1 hypothetical protein Q502_08430 [Mesotoga sp. Brook.08.YT.4.2.5.2.]